LAALIRQQRLIILLWLAVLLVEPVQLAVAVVVAVVLAAV
jgi:hypothetical protein